MHQRDYHIVVLGSGGVGKSCLTAQFVNNVWIESYDPTIEDSYRKQFEVDGRHVMLEILDTAGTEQFTAMRELYMKSGQGFLLVFSLTNPTSLSELTDIREQLVRIKDDRHVPIVLVGNKSDLQGTVTRESIKRATQGFGNIPYYETSARKRVNVDDAFRDLVRQIMIREREAEKATAAANGHERGGYAGGGAGAGHQGESVKQRDFADHQQRPEESRRRRRGKGGNRRCVIL